MKLKLKKLFHSTTVGTNYKAGTQLVGRMGEATRQKRLMVLEKKYSLGVHPWVKFIIQNVVLKEYLGEKNSYMFS